MGKLIDADKFLEAMYHEAFEVDHEVDGMQKWDSGCWIRYKLLENVLEDAPAIDAVEVIRCKDCKFFLAQNKNGNGNGCCEYGYFVHTSNSNDFCSSAERR